ncbi:siderophore-iron reductase FhuF [Ochrobactrum sp. RH2CCR150]|uniref:siderophore-iron reductase FhuF n=1 Tax=Ochrobactrum sp. RH2CCR150 TaxID=2587044 RepID=UPI0015FC8137|nr:ferric iron reductase protein FhuF [Ochrobactrum sp. RH2CCR150]
MAVPEPTHRDALATKTWDPHVLDKAIDERFAYCRGKMLLASPEENAIIPCSDLTDAAVFSEVIERFASSFPGGDRRAIISMWTMYYFSIVSITPTVLRLVCGKRLPLKLDRTVLVCKPANAAPTALLLDHSGDDANAPERTFDLLALMRDHIEPLIEAICTNAKVAPKLLWNNVAGYYSWIVDEIGTHVNPDLGLAGRALLDEPLWPDGGKNPMYGMMRTAQPACGNAIVQRKVCCLRYTLPGVAGCGQLCPLPNGRH